MNLLRKLRDILPKSRISNDPAELYCYSSDASYITGTPDYVAMPCTTAEVSKIVRLARKHRVPVTARGAGTGLAGGAVPLRGGIVLDMSRMNRILDIDLSNLQVLVEPGIIHADLNRSLAPYGFFFPPDPGSSEMCTLGGLIANRGSGMRSVKYGTVTDYVLDLEVVMPDGEVIHTGSKVMKSASGYDLTAMMVGSEGTLGVITEARLKVHPLPEARAAVLAHFNDLESAGSVVSAIMSCGLIPSACELMDGITIKAVNMFDPDLNIPDCAALMLIEVDGAACSVRSDAAKAADCCSKLGAFNVRIASSGPEMQELWTARRLAGAAVTRLNPGKTRVYIGEDVAVPLSAIPEMLTEISAISRKHGLPIMTYGHAGDGNLHTGMAIDTLDEIQWEVLKQAADDIHRAALLLDGSVSGEHGIGSARSIYMDEEHGRALDVMASIKKALDPCNIMNPLKVGLK